MAIKSPLRFALRDTVGWRILDALRNALLPNRCAGCSAWIAAVDAPRALPEKIRPGLTDCGNRAAEDQIDDDAAALQASGLLGLDAMLCEICRQEIVPVQSPICTICGRMFRSRQGPDHRCGDCIRQPKHFSSARSALLYTPGFRKVVHRYKYQGELRLCGPLGDILLASFLRFWGSGDMDLILPVPLHPKRFRHRGFNQAYRLMRHWKVLDGRLAATPRLLVRTRATASQTGLGKAQRRRNVRNAFAVQRPETIRSRRVLLVDDVYTTGATADEIARVLLRAGAGRVDVLTLARSA